MPLFEYSCKTCGQTIEVLQKDARVLTTCGGDCVSADDGWGEGELDRVLSAHNTLSGGLSKSVDAPTCGSCGMAPGSCGEN